MMSRKRCVHGNHEYFSCLCIVGSSELLYERYRMPHKYLQLWHPRPDIYLTNKPTGSLILGTSAFCRAHQTIIFIIDDMMTKGLPESQFANPLSNIGEGCKDRGSKANCYLHYPVAQAHATWWNWNGVSQTPKWGWLADSCQMYTINWFIRALPNHQLLSFNHRPVPGCLFCLYWVNARWKCLPMAINKSPRCISTNTGQMTIIIRIIIIVSFYPR